MMISRDHVEAVLNLKQSDRVPIFDDFDAAFIKSVGRYYTNPVQDFKYYVDMSQEDEQGFFDLMAIIVRALHIDSFSAGYFEMVHDFQRMPNSENTILDVNCTVSQLCQHEEPVINDAQVKRKEELENQPDKSV